MSLTIRNATSADLEALLDLYLHLNPVDEPLPDDDVLQQRWLAFVTQPGFTCLLGFNSERLVCSCCLAILPNLTRGARPYALIENVVTHTDFRKRGFGTTIVLEALRRAWDAECYKAMLLSGSRRPETHRFYASCGFRSDDKTGFVARPD